MGIFLNVIFISFGASRQWGLYFQDTASPQMEALVELHDNIMFYLVIILFGVAWILLSIISNYIINRSPISNKYLNHVTLIELIWTITLGFILVLIAVPYLHLTGQITDTSLTIPNEGHELYLSHQYPESLNSDEEELEFDSYLVPESDIDLTDTSHVTINHFAGEGIDSNSPSGDNVGGDNVGGGDLPSPSDLPSNGDEGKDEGEHHEQEATNGIKRTGSDADLEVHDDLKRIDLGSGDGDVPSAGNALAGDTLPGEVGNVTEGSGINNNSESILEGLMPYDEFDGTSLDNMNGIIVANETHGEAAEYFDVKGSSIRNHYNSAISDANSRGASQSEISGLASTRDNLLAGLDQQRLDLEEHLVSSQVPSSASDTSGEAVEEGESPAPASSAEDASAEEVSSVSSDELYNSD